ncbi:flagellar motor switch protein FliM [Sphingomonas guangdongensis]|uniref:Flagellar motor switch protein FliM n=1 Tax=Sphingomonas guangdongensis TaxID=1141890 RepID=A0A285QF90_9SPHN|nr:flagellar motor switch protein FliM [Sphingomonas guangdongensis]SOB80154.1 flagellar motor switch protein FliM [Sphingomonas guangdongensis]
MVNGTATETIERRERPRGAAEHVASLGVANLNPFGDLHTLQHLSARLARSLRGVFEPVLRRSLRTWAEPLVVQRFADYSAERDGRLTAWLPIAMTPDCRALAVFDGSFVVETLDLFFGGTGEPPKTLPSEFTPAAEAMIRRLGQMLARPLATAWEPLARLTFTPGNPEASPAMLQGIDGDDAMIVTRFGLAVSEDALVYLDIVYPVAALKPFAPTLTGKVLGRSAEPEPKWRAGLTRAAMNVKFPVRSVLAEPVISLAQLMELKVGDVIPVSFGADVPVMVGGDRLGTGTVGTSNGKAAIRITELTRLDEEDSQ